MSPVIIPKSDQINADDLISGPITITIRAVHIKAGTEQPVSIDFGDDKKVYRPCKSMSRVIVAAWGADSSKYKGRSLTLYRDPKVKWGGMEVGGIRISHMSDLQADMTLALTETRANRKPFTVRQLAANTKAAAPTPTATNPSDYADELEFVIDRATDLTTFGPHLNAAIKTAEWKAFVAEDPERAASIKAKGVAKVAELKWPVTA
jgi:hypothetical protein